MSKSVSFRRNSGPMMVLKSLTLMLAFGFAGAAQAQPTFSKLFSPDFIGPGSVSTLTFTIDNTANGAPAESLAFTDNLVNMAIATPANATSNCTGAVINAPDGGASIQMTDGAVPAGGVCVVSVDITSTNIGANANTSSALSSTLGSSGSATDTLTVDNNRPGFSKSFAPASVNLGERSTLSFNIDNSLNAAERTNMLFTDNLPFGIVVADPTTVSNDCASGSFTGGIVTAVPGSSVISLTGGGTHFAAVGAGASCVISVEVVATVSGSLDNVTSELSSTPSPFGPIASSGKASATLTVGSSELTLIKSFTDDPVGPGGTVTLRFDILNINRFNAATAVAFSDDLGAMLTGTTVSSVDSDTCNGTPDTSVPGVFSYSGGSLVADGGTCEIVISLAIPAGATEGVYPNTTSPISASTGTFSAASDTLFVFAAPVISKTFIDNPVAANSTTELEFTITNSNLTTAATAISFVDVVTDGLSGVTLNTLPAAGFCGGGAAMFNTAAAPAIRLFMNGGDLAAGASCTFSVILNVPAGFPGGTYTNTTEPVTGTIGGIPRTGNQASDDLVVVGAPRISKSFTDDPVAPGANVTLRFELSQSLSAPGPATNIAFSDDLGAMLAGTTVNSVTADTCGGTPDTGTPGVFSYTGGSLAVGASCIVSISLAVPLGAIPGTYTNTANALSADGGDGSGGSLMVTGSQATDDLLVTGLVFSKQFLSNPVLPGGVATLRFTLDNSAAPGGQDATAIAFVDNLAAFLSGAVAIGLPVSACGGTLSGTTLLDFTGGSVAAGATCFFDVNVQVPLAAADNIYPNQTGVLTAMVSGGGLTLPPANDNLSVQSDFLTLSKNFTDSPASAGGNATLEFTLGLDANAPESVQGIAFTDDLDAMLTGATFSLTSDGCAGTLAGVGTGLLDASAITLAPGASCTILVSVSVPGGTPSGAYNNTTSTLSGTTTPGGLAVTGGATSDVLIVTSTNVTLSKSFSGFGVPGGAVDLNFTIENLDSGAGLDNMAFSDDLGAVLPGLAATGEVINNVCGTGSMISGTSVLTFTAGNLPASGSCTFSVTLQLPVAPAPGAFLNTTSNLFVQGVAANGPATALLYIPPPPVFTKAFAPNPIAQGGVSTLTFTIDNSAATEIATNLAFGDTFPAGMVVAPTPNGASTCGGSVTALAGSGLMSFSGGNVGVGAICQVSVDVTTATAGSRLNTSTALTSLFGNSGTASDTLVTNPPPGFSKAFAPNPIAVGGVSTLTFTIDNTASVDALGVGFGDTFPAGLIVATPANVVNTCTGGTLAAAAGSGVVSYSGGTAPATSSCIISVDVTAAAAGDYVNTSGVLTTSNLNAGPVATDTLRVNPPPVFSKAFAPATVAPGAPSTLTFTVDNIAGTVAATSLDFTDNFPANLVVATPPGASTTCTGGTITASAGTGTISYTGGTVAAAGTCTVQVDVNSALPGSYNNTSGALTSSLGNSAPANAVLNVTDSPLVFSKAFAPATVDPGQVSTLTFRLDNGAGLAQADTLDFTDNLPAGMQVAATPNASTTCTGGTVNANAGTGVVSYTGGSVAAGATCTVQADVIGTLAGALVNTSGNLTSTLGNSGAANATLTVNTAPLLFSKAFAPATVNVGAVSTLTFTLDNSAVAVPAANVNFTDTLPAGMQVAATPNASSTCIGNVNIDPGVISYVGGSLGAGATCSIQVDVISSAGGGASTNVSGNLTSSLGDSGTATAVLNVNAPYVFVKLFSPATVVVGDISRLSFFINDNGSLLPSSNLAFSDNLPAGMVVASAPNVSNSCGGTVTANPGGGAINLVGGGLGSGANCVIEVDVQATALGSLLNTTGALSSSLGNSGPASGTLVVGVASTVTIPTDGGGDSTVTLGGADPACGFTRAQWIPLAGAPNSPPAGSSPAGLIFPYGLFDFAIGGDGCIPGATYSINVVLPSNPGPDATYWKYGPTPSDPLPHWYQLPAVFSGNMVDFSITDGGLGDDDLLANGEVIDQGGPAIPDTVAAIPALDEWAKWSMVALLLLLGMALLGRRREQGY